MRPWSVGVRRRVVELAETAAAVDEANSHDLALIAQRATDLLPLLRERKAPAKRLGGESTKARRERKRREHAAETARIREERMRIAGDRCEFMVPGSAIGLRCGRTTDTDVLHMHHLLSGSGRRRQKQSVETVRMLCEWHHREAHRASKKPAPRAAAQTDASKGGGR